MENQEEHTSSQSLNASTEAKWSDFVGVRILQNDVPEDNGYNFCGSTLPLELILCGVGEEDILKCNLVSYPFN